MDYASLEPLLVEIIHRLLKCPERERDEPVFQVADAEAIARLRQIGISAEARECRDVVEQMLSDIYPHRARMDHPRSFAFIPSPASPLSWIGDLLTAAHNPHMGSWFQSSGPSCIEAELVAWLAAQLGYPPVAGGLFVSGGSMANLTALTVARDQMLSEEERTRGVAYVSEQTHFSAARGLRIIGLLDRQIRKIAVDAQFRMDVRELREAIARDRVAGLQPFAVVASAGTTNTGAIDPLHEIADLCAAERLWMHVDGAYGASLALSPMHRPLISGIERADSVAWDAHKWLFQTYGCGLILVRERKHLAASFHALPEYLRDAQSSDDSVNFWDYGPEQTRPARALKLWLTLQVLGTRAIGEMIDHGIQLAEWAEDELRRHEHWQIVSPAQLAIVTFRYVPPGVSDESLDAINTGISRQINDDGFAGILTTRLNGRTVLRICAMHPEATEEDMRETIHRLNQYAQYAACLG